MVNDEYIAKETCKLLLQINAIKLNPKNPFAWASGWKSPIYCDNRIILSFPAVREKICSFLSQQIKKRYEDYDVIAGVATGAIGIGMLVADKLNKPFVYVRADRKKHGRKNMPRVRAANILFVTNRQKVHEMRHGGENSASWRQRGSRDSVFYMWRI